MILLVHSLIHWPSCRCWQKVNKICYFVFSPLLLYFITLLEKDNRYLARIKNNMLFNNIYLCYSDCTISYWGTFAMGCNFCKTCIKQLLCGIWKQKDLTCNVCIVPARNQVGWLTGPLDMHLLSYVQTVELISLSFAHQIVQNTEKL